MAKCYMFESNRVNYWSHQIYSYQTRETEKSIYWAVHYFLPNSYTPKINHPQIPQSDMENLSLKRNLSTSRRKWKFASKGNKPEVRLIVNWKKKKVEETSLVILHTWCNLKIGLFTTLFKLITQDLNNIFLILLPFIILILLYFH